MEAELSGYTEITISVQPFFLHCVFLTHWYRTADRKFLCGKHFLTNVNLFRFWPGELWVVKLKAMNTDTIQQEVMIVTGTSFSQLQFSERDNKDEGKKLSAIEKLEQALWDGLLDELLPEISPNKNLPIWLIWNTGTSLQIELGKYPNTAIWASINPYTVFKTMNLN